MKILITTDWYSPAVNGVVTSVKNLRRGLEARGHEVRILTLSQDHHGREEDGVTYLRSMPVVLYPGARLRPPLVRRTLQELAEWRPDVVHSQCEFSTFYPARRIAEYLNIPLVHTYHTVYEDYTHYITSSVRLGRTAVTLLTRWVAAQSDCFIAPTGKVRQLLLGYGVDKPVFVVPSGIDLSRFSGEPDPIRQAVLRQSLGIPQENLILATVGRIAEEKNMEELIRFRANLGDAPVTLLIVGEGPDRSRLEGIAAELGLTFPALIFTGLVQPAEIPAWYQLADLYVSASTSETQGLTYIEALASGMPALCRADPCLAGVIREGENGWQYRDEADFRRKLADFIAHPEWREGMSAAARRSVRPYSVEAFAESVEDIYRQQILRRDRGTQEVSA